MQRLFSTSKLWRTIPSYATHSIAPIAPKLHESQHFMKWGFRMMSRFATGFNPLREKPLDSIVDIHRLKDRYPDDIASIWDDYHIGRGHIGATMKAKLYHLLDHRAKECRYFVIPLWRGNGYTTMFLQVQTPYMVFTGLEDYKARGTQASPYYSVCFYTEFAESKDLVLIRGDIVFTSKLTDSEAKWLMETAQSFYLNDVRYKLVERVLDSAGLEAEATSGSILHRTASFTANVLATSHSLLFLTDARAGLHPLDQEVGKWLRRNAPQVKPILVMNKSESLFDADDSLASAANEMSRLGFGDPIAISAETGLGMHDLFLSLKPVLEDYMVSLLNDESARENICGDETSSSEADESKLPLQLAIVGRPNVGKSTLLNTLLQEDRVLVGPEAGLTRDAIRTQFEFQGRTIYLVDTAGWLQRTKLEKGASSLSIMQSRKSLLRAHIIALVLDADEIVNAKRSMKHAEVVIARRAVEEGRGLVVIVNKMDLLRGKDKSSSYEQIMEVVQQEIQTVIPQITGIPVLFISALEGRGRTTVLHQVIDTYEKWCTRLSTARLNRWLQKVMSRHSWKDQAAQPKIKYFTQVKARPPTFVAFVRGKARLSDTDIRFLTKSLKDDFDLGGIPIRIMQRAIAKKDGSGTSKSIHSAGRVAERIKSDKRERGNLVESKA